jgi:hypothetical protein
MWVSLFMLPISDSLLIASVALPDLIALLLVLRKAQYEIMRH